jgi:hypothetical protein
VLALVPMAQAEMPTIPPADDTCHANNRAFIRQSSYI